MSDETISARRSTLLCTTLRENPSESDLPGHQFLVRGGYVQPLAAGIYSLLPLGQRVVAKISEILREEMNAVEGQEVLMPVVQPAELWQETKRWYHVGPELLRFQDRAQRDMVLAMTHEEVVADILRRNVRSYRQLPLMVYQIQTKFRDEPRPRGGLLRVREFLMKDAYSCHASSEDLDSYYPQIYQAYYNIFRRAGIEVISVEGDVGMMGGTMSHEFMSVQEIGEDRLAICDQCGYAANLEIASFRKDTAAEEEERPLQEVETPGTTTIAQLAQLLGVHESRTAKAAFFMAGDHLIFAVIRGDLEVNEMKLAHAVGTLDLRPAQPEDLLRAGIVAGYASPIGLEGVTVVVDDSVTGSRNLVAGANKPGFHLLNTNIPRDYSADVVTDIASAYEGAPCPVCGRALRLTRGVEVGHIFKLGTRFTEALGANFLDEGGQLHPIIMASYGIGVGRLMATIAEACRDERGLLWPVTVAPFEVYLVGLDLDDEPVRCAAEDLFGELSHAGVQVLYDDRQERAGVKFVDGDLLGMPLRVTVSRRTLQGDAVELKPRAGGDMRHVPRSDALAEVQRELERMKTGILARLRPESLRDQ